MGPISCKFIISKYKYSFVCFLTKAKLFFIFFSKLYLLLPAIDPFRFSFVFIVCNEKGQFRINCFETNESNMQVSFHLVFVAKFLTGGILLSVIISFFFFLAWMNSLSISSDLDLKILFLLSKTYIGCAS